jgi:subtilisin family serine protease
MLTRILNSLFLLSLIALPALADSTVLFREDLADGISPKSEPVRIKEALGVQNRVSIIYEGRSFRILAVSGANVTESSANVALQGFSGISQIESSKTVRLVDPQGWTNGRSPRAKDQSVCASASAAQASPNDACFLNQWSSAPASITQPIVDAGGTATVSQYDSRVYGLWQSGKIGRRDSQGPIIAVVDTGIQRNHPDLAANIYSNPEELNGRPGVDDDQNGFVDDTYGWNMVSNNNNTSDDNNHGTHCAGIIGAVANGAGIVGTMHQARILPVKVLGSDGSGTTEGVIRGFQYAVKMGAKIVSMSLGGGDTSQSFLDAIRDAADHGVLVTIAAGNDGWNNDQNSTFPANYKSDNIISVAAIQSNGTLASFSNYGMAVHIGAPGKDIWSTVPSSNYDSYSGTSMATPLVAGVAGLLWSEYPSESYRSIRGRILGCARPGLSGRVKTGSIIDATNAMSRQTCTSYPTGEVGDLTSSRLLATRLTLNWSYLNSADNAVVKMVQGSTPPADCDSGKSAHNERSYTFTGLTPETQYSFRVCAVSLTGQTSNGKTLTLSTNALIPPPPVSSLSQESPAFATRIRWQWSPPTGVAQDILAPYTFEVVEGGEPSPKECKDLAKQTTGLKFESVGLVQQRQYTLKVCAQNLDGLYSSPRYLDVETTPIRIPTEVQSLRVSDNSLAKQHTIAWNPSLTPVYGGIQEGYKVILREQGPGLDCLPGSSQGETQRVLSGLKPDTQYYARVCVDNGDGGISSGTVVDFQTPPLTIEMVPIKVKKRRIVWRLKRNWIDDKVKAFVERCDPTGTKCKLRSIRFKQGRRETRLFRTFHLKPGQEYRFKAWVGDTVSQPMILRTAQ